MSMSIRKDSRKYTTHFLTSDVTCLVSLFSCFLEDESLLLTCGLLSKQRDDLFFDCDTSATNARNTVCIQTDECTLQLSEHTESFK